jgi:F-type H+-transporting ATPase subunit b
MDIDWFTFGAQVVNFLLLMALLRWLLYDPIVEAMAAREERIASRLAEAKAKEEAAEAEAAAYRRRQEELKRERHQRMEEAQAEAEATRQALVRAARREVEHLQARWEHALRRDQAQAVEALQEQAARQVVETARRVLNDLASTHLEEQMVATFLDRLQAEAPLPADGDSITVSTARPLASAQRAQLEAGLRAQMEEPETTLHYEVEEALVCGIEVRGTGWKVAWSVDAHLETLRQRIESLLEEMSASPPGRPVRVSEPLSQ